MDGFSVDVQALTDAGEGIAELVKMLGERDVKDIDCDKSAVGHDGLADKLESFCDRWQIGVENLVEDGNQVSKKLLDSAATYRDHEQAASTAFQGGGSHG